MYNNHHFSLLTGVLKGRWRCLKLERGLHYSPKKAAEIAKVCAALHNICLQMDFEEYFNDEDRENEDVVLPAAQGDHNLYQRGAANRQYIVDNII